MCVPGTSFFLRSAVHVYFRPAGLRPAGLGQEMLLCAFRGTSGAQEIFYVRSVYFLLHSGSFRENRKIPGNLFMCVPGAVNFLFF